MPLLRSPRTIIGLHVKPEPQRCRHHRTAAQCHMIRVDTARILTNLTHCILKISTRCRWLPSTIPMTTSTSSPAHDFPIDGAALFFLCQFMDANGGEAAFQGLTTDNFKNRFIAPKTQAANLCLSAQTQQQGDMRIQPEIRFESYTLIQPYTHET